MPSSPQEVQGLTAHLDKLCHHFGGLNLPPGKPHAFVYYITISNAPDRVITLLGRKWVIEHADGTHLVVEGERIVGEAPRLAPGESFSYNSYHATGQDAVAHGCFFGVDEQGGAVQVQLPPFALQLPRE